MCSTAATVDEYIFLFFISTTICYDSLSVASCSGSKRCTKSQNNNNNTFQNHSVISFVKVESQTLFTISHPRSVCNSRLAYETHTAVFHHFTRSEITEDDATPASLHLCTWTIIPFTNKNKMCKLLKFHFPGCWRLNKLLQTHFHVAQYVSIYCSVTYWTCRANARARTGSFMCEEPIHCWSKPVNVSKRFRPKLGHRVASSLWK